MKLSEYAKNLGISYKTAYYMFHRNEIPNAFQLPSGTIVIPPKETTQRNCDVPVSAVIYSRVSSSENKANLEKQSERLYNYAIAKGYKIHKIIKEVGSGINDQRKQLTSVLQDNDYNILIVEHKDRLTRFGFNYIKVLIEQLGKQIEVVNEATDQENDLMQDFISIITSFCARIYGHRRSKRKTEQIIKELQENDSLNQNNN